MKRYSFAMTCFFVAFLIRAVVLHEAAARAEYITYFPAVALAAMYGGLFPGLLTAILSATAVALWREPLGAVVLVHGADWLGWFTFLASSMLICWIAENMHRSRRATAKAEANRVQAEERAHGLEERRHYQQQLQESERKYRIVAENTFAWEFWLSPEETYIYNSPSCLSITGYSQEELAQDPNLFLEIIHPEDRAAYLDHRGTVPRQGCATPSAEFRIIRRDGEIRWIGHNCSPIHDENGTYLGVRGSNRDITEQKRAENALRLSEEKFAKAFALNPAAITLTRLKDGLVLDVNETWEQMLGYSREQAIGQTTVYLHLWPTAEDRERLIEELRPTGSVRGWEQSVLKKSGDPIVTLASFEILNVGEQQVILGTWLDITERKRVHDAIRLSEDKFAKTFNLNPAAIVMTRLKDGMILDVNQTWLETFGYTRQEAVGRCAFELNIWPKAEDRARFVDEMLKKRMIRGWEQIFFRKTGESFVAWLSAETLDVAGEETVVSVVLDITDRKRAEEQLRESERRLSVLFNSDILGTIYWTTEGTVTDANEKFLRIVGYSREELNAGLVNWAEMTPPEYKPLDTAALAELRENGVALPYEKEFVRKDGTRVPIIIGAAMLDDKRHDGVAFVLDITARKKAEEALRVSEESLRAIFDNAGVGIVEVTDDDHFIKVNQRACEILGRDCDELLQMNVHELTAPEDRALSGEMNARIHEGREQRISYQKRYLRGDNSRVWAHVTISAVRDAEGRWLRSIATIEDITERKQAEEALRKSESRFRQLADSMPQIVWASRPDGVLDYFNKKWYELTGAEEGVIGDEGWLPVMHADDRQRCIEQWYESVRTGEPYQIEYRFIFPAFGEYRWHLGRALPVRNEEGQIIRWFGTCTDIHDQKRQQEELAKANEQMAEADRRKNEFLAMLAHELRNPLAPIRNAVEVLRLTGHQDSALQRHRATIERQVSHMARLLDDLLDVSRVTRGMIHLKKRPLDLRAALEQAFETARPLIEERRHRFLFNLPEENLLVEGDLDRLAQIFGNLLTNSAKYTPEGGQIWIQAMQENGEVVVKVGDTGIGVAADMLPHIFDLFTQAKHAGKMAQGGLGIGLTMVRNLVRLHGGEVEARSEGPGKGSEFVVRLPALAEELAAEESAPVRATAKSMAEAGKKCARRVLVVDDVADAAASLAELLEIWGCSVQVATDGMQGLELVKRFSPDMVLLDIGMPGMDGYEVARRIRAQSVGPSQQPVLVALTGFGQTEDIEASRAAGFDKHLVKPVDLELLEALVRG